MWKMGRMPISGAACPPPTGLYDMSNAQGSGLWDFEPDEMTLSNSNYEFDF